MDDLILLHAILRLRDVSTLSSWVYCFLAYIAMRSDETMTRNLLAYARLVVRESQRHGGIGWMDYDRVFRQQAAIDNLSWNSIHPGIQAATVWNLSDFMDFIVTFYCIMPDHAHEHAHYVLLLLI